jgi:organic radical activating enzyme
MKENFCAAPWSSLSVDPDGKAKVCCISQQREPLIEFDQVSTNAKFIEIRNSFIADQQHDNCVVCWDREKASVEWQSRRSIYQYDHYHDLNDPTKFKLEHLDLRWSNTCNLNCVYCGPVFSSKWAELNGSKQKFRVLPAVSDADLVNLRTLQLAGGEPMLIKENLNILQRLISINPDVKIEVTTNLTQIQNNPIYRCLQNFDDVTFVVSFESTDARFEYIRNGARWSEFQRNLDTLAMDFLDIQFNMVYFPLSAVDIVNASELALHYTSPENIFVVAQSGGHGFDMLSNNAVQYIKQHNLEQVVDLPDPLKQRLLDQINMITTQCSETYLPMYDNFDQLTKQNHKSIFTELYQ